MNFCADPNILRLKDRSDRTGKAERGFTLVEILVAVAVFALLVTTLFGAFNRLFTAMEALEKENSVYVQARVCFDRMITDLRSVYVLQPPAYAPPDFDDEPDPYRFICENGYGEGGRLRFAAFSHLPLGSRLPAEVGRIVYYLHTTSWGETVLMRSDEILQSGVEKPAGNDPVVCEKVKSFAVECFDAEGEAYEDWDSDDGEFDYATPRAVRVVLKVEGGNGRVYRFRTVVELPVYREKTNAV